MVTIMKNPAVKYGWDIITEGYSAVPEYFKEQVLSYLIRLSFVKKFIKGFDVADVEIIDYEDKLGTLEMELRLLCKEY